MEMKQLTQRQLYGTKRETLEKKVIKYFQETRDVDSVIEYAIAIMVRHALVLGDFSLLFQDLIREIYLHIEPSETMKTFLPYFQSYFSESEWKRLINQLFKNERNYFKSTKKIRIYESYLRKKGTAVVNRDFDSYCLVSIFKDTNGKKHTWKLRDADPRNTKAETERILKILTTLTIFQNDNGRRFAEFVDYDCVGTSIISSSRTPKEQPAKASVQNSAAAPITDAVSPTADTDMLDGCDLNLLSKEDLIKLIKDIFKEAQTSMLEEELFLSNENFSKNKQSHAQETCLDSRNNADQNEIIQNQPDDLRDKTEKVDEKVPALAGVGTESDDNGGKPPEKPKSSGRRKKLTKKEKRLMNTFKAQKKRA